MPGDLLTLYEAKHRLLLMPLQALLSKAVIFTQPLLQGAQNHYKHIEALLDAKVVSGWIRIKTKRPVLRL